MDHHEAPASSDMPELPQKIYEPVFAHHMEMEEYLKQELALSYVDLDGSHELKTCHGDILKIINALMDYTRMLNLVCGQWKLTGFRKATYEYQAGKLREIAEKFQTAIGYDYAAAMEKCRKKQAKKQRSDDVGEEALTLTVRKRQKTSEKDTEEGKTEQPESQTAESSSPYPSEEIPAPREEQFKKTLFYRTGGIHMTSIESRKALEGHLDLLKRNLAVTSLEVLKTKYKKPFDELRHKVSAAAAAYVKQVTLETIRIRADFMDEAQPLIQGTIDRSGILKQISAAAFERQDLAEIDQLALALKEQIHQALLPFYDRHVRLYLDEECFGDPPKAPKFYNEATGCIWKENAWVPMEPDPKALLLPVQDKPKTAA